jgi:hypothetical protein
LKSSFKIYSIVLKKISKGKQNFSKETLKKPKELFKESCFNNPAFLLYGMNRYEKNIYIEIFNFVLSMNLKYNFKLAVD